ncbi:zinc metallopeptidase [Candidatus Saganbacteria bacterium]|nr:zinc metallopeptidase [Candidatus Saganbacteria bacterium]
MFYYNDPTFFLLIPAFLLALYAQFKVKSTFAKYSEVNSNCGLPGARVGRELLDSAGLKNIPVEKTEGELTDHYDPRDKTLHLSSQVYGSPSVAALGVVAHEVGHALQDAKAYVPLAFRNNLVPVANLGSQLAIPLFFLGLIAGFPMFMDLGIIAFSLAVVFQVITLPVEFNASSRAIKILSGGRYLTAEELPMARAVLNAAALTYVAATAMAVLNLVRLLALRGRRD